MCYGVTFQYMYTTCNHQIRVIGTSITSDTHHLFVLETLKILSTSYFGICNNCCQPWLSYQAMEHQKLFLESRPPLYPLAILWGRECKA